MYPTRTTSATGTFRVPAVAAPALAATPAPAPAPAPVPVRGAAPPREAVPHPVPQPAPHPVPHPVPHPAPPSLSGETSTGWATTPAVLLAAGPEVPAARAQVDEPEPVHTGLDIPHPQAETTHAGTATLRLRVPDTETAPPPQPEPWPNPEPAVRRPASDSGPAPTPATVPAPTPPRPEPAAAPGPDPRPAQATPPRPTFAPAPVPARSAAPAEPTVAAQPEPAPRSAAAPAAAPAQWHTVAGPRPDPLPAHAFAPAQHQGAAQPEPNPRPVPAPVPAPSTAPAEPKATVEPAAAVEPKTAAACERQSKPAPEPGVVRSGVPGPGVVEIVAQAVARGLEEEDDTQGIPVPHVTRLRGTAVTEVPVHLPFRGAQKSRPTPAPAPARAPRPASAPRPAPGRRVPRGDDRLREHRGPVLPGWIGVGIGGLALAGCAAVLWRAGAVPDTVVAAFGATPRAYRGLHATHWPPLAFLGIVALLALGGLGRSRAGHAWVLTLFGRYRGTVRRTGLTWISPLLLRRRVDVRLRHWRSEPMPAVDSGGLALQVVVQVVWQVKDTARAALAVEDHVEYLAEQVESAMARVLSQLPADAFHEDAPTLRDTEAVGDALTRMLAAETEAVGIEVFSAQPTRIEYAPEVAEAMRRRRVAAIDAKHRDAVLSSVVDAVDDTVHRLTSRGLVELDDYERKALVKDLTVAFYTGRCE